MVAVWASGFALKPVYYRYTETGVRYTETGVDKQGSKHNCCLYLRENCTLTPINTVNNNVVYRTPIGSD